MEIEDDEYSHICPRCLKRWVLPDKGLWYKTVTHEVECRECGTIYDFDEVKYLPRCPKCSGDAKQFDIVVLDELHVWRDNADGADC